jgi:hypothetical protein
MWPSFFWVTLNWSIKYVRRFYLSLFLHSILIFNLLEITCLYRLEYRHWRAWWQFWSIAPIKSRNSFRTLKHWVMIKCKGNTTQWINDKERLILLWVCAQHRHEWSNNAVNFSRAKWSSIYSVRDHPLWESSFINNNFLLSFSTSARNSCSWWFHAFKTFHSRTFNCYGRCSKNVASKSVLPVSRTWSSCFIRFVFLFALSFLNQLQMVNTNVPSSSYCSETFPKKFFCLTV